MSILKIAAEEAYELRKEAGWGSLSREIAAMKPGRSKIVANTMFQDARKAAINDTNTVRTKINNFVQGGWGDRFQPNLRNDTGRLLNSNAMRRELVENELAARLTKGKAVNYWPDFNGAGNHIQK